MLKLLLIAATLAFSAGAAAQQYRWVDQNGRIQYGDTPPAGAKVTPLRPASPSSSPTEAKKEEAKKAPATLAERDADFRKRQQDAEKEREKQAAAQREADDKRENCARAKEALRVLEGGRVARVDAKGERYFLDDAQLSQESARARQAAQQWCS
jgi:Domain of unknown function (DUF4124)